MSQTTGAMSSIDARMQTSPDGTNWTDHSGEATRVTPTGGGRQTGSRNTLEGDFPVVTNGKRILMDVEVEYLYTEGASDLFEVVRAAYEAGTALYVRWAPKGGQTGEFQFTTTVGRITDFLYPPVDAESADPI